MNLQQLSLEELKKVQLGIVVAIDAFCKEHGIDYSLAYGSLIGAVRHKGFIPWDDDIDICLLRADYDRLVKEFPETYGGRFKLYSLERNAQYARAYARACDDTTIEIIHENINYPPMGVGIDVFPIDKVPDDDAEWERFDRRRYLTVRTYMKKAYLHWEPSHSFARNMAAMVLKGLLKIVSFKTLAQQIDKKARKYNDTTSHFLFESAQGLVSQKRIPAKDFRSFVSVDFEGHKLQAMAGYDNYLRLLYGDYMQLPPEGKRVSHHNFTAYKK